MFQNNNFQANIATVFGNIEKEQTKQFEATNTSFDKKHLREESIKIQREMLEIAKKNHAEIVKTTKSQRIALYTATALCVVAGICLVYCCFIKK